MRISIVLPKFSTLPVGGFKVHYQYANALAARGHRVTVVHPAGAGAWPRLSDELPIYLRALAEQVALRHAPIRWFDLDPAVDVRLVPILRSARLPAADVTVLTAWQTAERTVAPAVRAGRLAQIVYDYEHWRADPGRRPRIARALGRPDVAAVATSTAVARMLLECGKPAIATVTAGLDDGEFGVDLPTTDRQAVVGFPLRAEAAKDMPTAFEAARIVAERRPDARIECFGAAGVTTPSWVVPLGRLTPAQLRAFYNRCAVFMLTSRWEGWGLPALEAMACGAAVVSTRNGGTEDFVVDGHDGLLFPVGDPEALAAGVLRLLRDDDERQRLAAGGIRSAAMHRIDASADRLESVLRVVATAPDDT